MYILTPILLYCQHCPLEIDADNNHKSGQFPVVLITLADSSGHAPNFETVSPQFTWKLSPKRKKNIVAFAEKIIKFV